MLRAQPQSGSGEMAASGHKAAPPPTSPEECRPLLTVPPIRTSRPFPTGGLRSQPGFGVSREEHVLCFVCENGMEEARNSTFTHFKFSSGTIANEMLICPLHDFPITRPETQTQGKQTAESIAKLSNLI